MTISPTDSPADLADSRSFQELNEAKEDFDSIYDRADPRAYYGELGGLGYRIPTEAKPVFARILDGLAEQRALARPTLADMGCSYGINAAMLKYDLTFRDLVERYRAGGLRGASASEVVAADTAFFRGRRPVRDVNVIGMDVAKKAVDYGCRVGLLKDGITQNLEEAPPSPRSSALLGEVDLVTSTGCVGYVTENSFRELVPRARRPWIASFVLRMFPYDAIADYFATLGLVTEKLRGRFFPQRAFASEEEKAGALETLSGLGIDPAGLEADGHYYAEFYLTRPRAEVAARPLDVLLGLSRRNGS